MDPAKEEIPAIATLQFRKNDFAGPKIPFFPGSLSPSNLVSSFRKMTFPTQAVIFCPAVCQAAVDTAKDEVPAMYVCSCVCLGVCVCVRVPFCVLLSPADPFP